MHRPEITNMYSNSCIGLKLLICTPTHAKALVHCQKFYCRYVLFWVSTILVDGDKGGYLRITDTTGEASDRGSAVSPVDFMK